MFYLLFLALAADIPAHPPDRDAVTSAMRKTLAGRADRRDANLEIIELSHFPVPDGEIEFEWKGLTPPASGQATERWRGTVHHDIDHTYSIWAVVRITVPCRRVVAAQTIKPDVPLLESDLREESYDGFPSESCDSGLNTAIGKVTTRILSTDTVILPSLLAPPAAVVKGEQAVAVYRSDGVSLTLPVVAERSGRVGETIAVRNPVSHKVLYAQVIGEGRVQVANGEKQ